VRGPGAWSIMGRSTHPCRARSRRPGAPLIPRKKPSLSLGIVLPCGRAIALARTTVVAVVAVAVLACAGPVAGSEARADTRIEVRESSWSAGQAPVTVEALVRTWVRGPARRIENQLLGVLSDSAIQATRFVQIDRLDRDSSYFVRPAEGAYIPVPYAGSRAQNRDRASRFRAARAAGTAPRDTLAPVRVTDLGRSRVVAGLDCRGYVLELTFAYRDTALTPGTELVGVLSDTVWIAPAGSPADEAARFERELARTTAADSLLASANAVQLAQARGLGLVTVLQRALRELPGSVLASHFVNLLRGLPRGLSGVERLADGTAVVQRTVRETVLLEAAPLPDSLFVPPPGFRRAERGGRAGRGEKAPPPP
jgi:hypothetical protein